MQKDNPLPLAKLALPSNLDILEQPGTIRQVLNGIKKEDLSMCNLNILSAIPEFVSSRILLF